MIKREGEERGLQESRLWARDSSIGRLEEGKENWVLSRLREHLLKVFFFGIAVQELLAKRSIYPIQKRYFFSSIMGGSVEGEEDEVVSAVDKSMGGGSTTTSLGQQQQEMVAVASAQGENFKRQDSSRDKAYRLWSKVKYQLVKFEALPEHLRDNEYILGHYRANWPLGPTLLSIFSFHNETLNIWTYGFFSFSFSFSFSLYVNSLFSFEETVLSLRRKVFS